MSKSTSVESVVFCYEGTTPKQVEELLKMFSLKFAESWLKSLGLEQDDVCYVANQAKRI